MIEYLIAWAVGLTVGLICIFGWHAYRMRRDFGVWF